MGFRRGSSIHGTWQPPNTLVVRVTQQTNVALKIYTYIRTRLCRDIAVWVIEMLANYINLSHASVYTLPRANLSEFLLRHNTVRRRRLRQCVLHFPFRPSELDLFKARLQIRQKHPSSSPPGVDVSRQAHTNTLPNSDSPWSRWGEKGLIVCIELCGMHFFLCSQKHYQTTLYTLYVLFRVSMYRISYLVMFVLADECCNFCAR